VPLYDNAPGAPKIQNMTWEMAWGTRRKAVREAQPGKADDYDDDVLTYSRELAGYIFSVSYVFDDKKLAMINVDYPETFDDDKEALIVWQVLLDKLGSDFGAPTRSFERARTSISEDDLEYWKPDLFTVFRWMVYENEHTRAVVTLEGSAHYFLTIEAQLSPR